jgi:hypothetical protein
MFKTPALKLAAPLPIVVRDWKGKSVVFVSAIEEVTVLEVAATGICPAVMPDSPLLPPLQVVTPALVMLQEPLMVTGA